MNGHARLSMGLLGQVMFFSLVLISREMPRMVFFGLFWVATLATLLVLLTMRRWDATSWVAFGAFSAATITAVLLSSSALVDATGVSVPVMGLLFVAAIISAIPERRRKRRQREVPAQRGLPEAFYSIPGSNTYHRKGCRMLTGRQELQAFLTEKEVRALGKKRCGICF